MHLGLARTYQILTLFPKETLLHNVMLALLGLDPAALESLGCAVRSAPAMTQARAARWRRSASATAPTAIVAETSYGERRRLEIAMALAQKPKVLLLDEPLAGLSQDERKTAAARCSKTIPRDVTIVMIEHDMDTALEFAERITLLHYGEVIVEGTPRRGGRRSAHAGGLSWRLSALAISRRRRLLRRQPCAARRELRA